MTNREMAINRLIKAIQQAGCNSEKLIADGVFGEQAIYALESFWYHWSARSEPQINAVIDAVKALLEANEEQALASLMKVGGTIGDKETGGIRRILELYDHQPAG